jgi:hypothetical protein
LIAGSGPRSGGPELVVRQLGPAQEEIVVSGGPSLILGVAAALFVFVGWCAMVVILAGLWRFWRDTVAEPVATAR